jgi:hypothetical protein
MRRSLAADGGSVKVAARAGPLSKSNRNKARDSRLGTAGAKKPIVTRGAAFNSAAVG